MDKIKKQALEAAGWKFGDAEDFLNEGRPMSDDKIRAEFEAYAEQRNWSIRKNHGSYYWAEAARAWHIWQAAYAAGQKAEREAIFIEWENGELLAAEVERLRAEVEMSHSFHRVAVKERDFERLLVEALKEELVAAKAASGWPAGYTEIRTNPGGNVVIYTENHENAYRLIAWLRDRMKERGEG